MPASERFDTVIIGAGMSGLAAGIRLAQFDQRVLVTDRHYLWGGLNSFYKLGGRRFDVGLHALTNYMPPGAPGAKRRPLARVLRQLRLSHADLQLGEQNYSAIAFPGVRLRFKNGFGLLQEDVFARFPRDADGFRRLVRDLADYPVLDGDAPRVSARERLAEYLTEALLIDMLLLPVCYYGSPTPGDIEWTSFVILFKSLYEEGFARPEGGVRTILDLLRHRYAELGGELRMRCGVERVLHSGGVARGVRLEDGTEVAAERVISSAGYVETMRLCGATIAASAVRPGDLGDLSFVESISVLDTKPAELGHDATITFFNSEDRLVYAKPEAPVDYRSGVICCPDNYACRAPAQEGLFRLTLLANYDAWTAFPEERYRAEKEELWRTGHGAITDFAPDIRPHTVFKDIFTPRTIEKFTGHLNGAVYGSPNKRTSGETELRGLYICGTDQGYLGIVGAMLSGVSIANRHALMTA